MLIYLHSVRKPLQASIGLGYRPHMACRMRLAAPWVVRIPYRASCVGLSSESQREKIECLCGKLTWVAYIIFYFTIIILI